MAYGSGNWLGLPEFGLTEALGGNKSSVYNAIGNTYTSQGVPSMGYSKVPSPTAGSTLGVSTAQPYSSPSYNAVPNTKVNATIDQNALEQERKARENQIRGNISSKANQSRSFLDDLSRQLQGYQQQDESSTRGMFDQVIGGVQSARDTGLQKLGYAREDVGQRTGSAINDLQQNLRNLMRATGMQLGAMGAGDSSASEIMAPYAFSKVGSNARAEVMNNANSQYNDINMKEQDIITTYDQEKTRLESDKISALSAIAQDYRNKFVRIQEAKNYANEAEKDALNNLEVSLLNDVSNKLSAVQNYVLQRNAELDQWANSRISSGWDTAQRIGDTSNYQAKEVSYNALPGLSNNPTFASQTDAGLNPMALARKKLQESRLG